ncbi:hypothetical protein HA050_04960 [Iodobacter sp. HSC-16F04]|uniref:DUF4177 domain-containing protein n=1 Tax=Iodobacter violaceini TaxID=3044271 RepID=A0ABX0KPG9_9NEIS|nr:hypothetical protein [Iodobacter violacea]NHQ85464.1 hypothetical protein [Iodobacter violacea]
MTELRINYESLSEALIELKHLKAKGWTLYFSNDGLEIIARKRFLFHGQQ